MLVCQALAAALISQQSGHSRPVRRRKRKCDSSWAAEEGRITAPLAASAVTIHSHAFLAPSLCPAIHHQSGPLRPGEGARLEVGGCRGQSLICNATLGLFASLQSKAHSPSPRHLGIGARSIRATTGHLPRLPDPLETSLTTLMTTLPRVLRRHPGRSYAAHSVASHPGDSSFVYPHPPKFSPLSFPLIPSALRSTRRSPFCLILRCRD